MSPPLHCSSDSRKHTLLHANNYIYHDSYDVGAHHPTAFEVAGQNALFQPKLLNKLLNVRLCVERVPLQRPVPSDHVSLQNMVE